MATIYNVGDLKKFLADVDDKIPLTILSPEKKLMAFRKITVLKKMILWNGEHVILGADIWAYLDERTREESGIN
jgi:hypothetical protein